MKVDMRGYACGMALALVSGAAPALPFSVTGGSAFPGQPVVAALNDASTSALEAATILIEFDPARLDYVSSAVGSLFPLGTITFENLLEESLGRVIVGVGSNTSPLTGGSGTLLAVSFGILANVPPGLTAVTFRCVPIDPGLPVNSVTDQASADQFCAPDYAIPATSGNVTVLAASTGQAPAPGTVPLALLGLGVIGWMRRKSSNVR